MQVEEIFSKFNTFQLDSPIDIPQEGYLFIYNSRISGFQHSSNLLFAPDGNIVKDISEIVSSLPVYVLNAKNYLICPKLIEQHIHGGFGINFNTCTVDEIIVFAEKIVDFGVGIFYPTIMTDDLDIINEQIKKVQKAKSLINDSHKKFAQIGGINLEGPFINEEKRGIHPKSKLLTPTLENIKKIDLSDVKIFTIAPELDVNFEAIKYLKEHNIVVSLGHSNSDSKTAKQAFLNGANLVTHTFNAMPSLHHRYSNLTSEALLNDAYIEIIVDFEHVNSDMLQILFKTKNKDRIIFISDALPLAHSEKNSLIFAGEEIFANSKCASNSSGTLAGSTMFLIDTYRQLKEHLKLSFDDFIRYAVINPSKLLGHRVELNKHNLFFFDKKLLS